MWRQEGKWKVEYESEGREGIKWTNEVDPPPPPDLGAGINALMKGSGNIYFYIYIFL
jgi:hypothetical protein